MSKIKNDEFQKSLDRLQSLAKGSQLYHTESDSDPGSWPGGTQEDLKETSDGDIHIDDNGTDYQGVRKSLAEKVRKSLALTPAEVAIAEGKNPMPLIGQKVSKGLNLTAAEQWAVKSGFKGMIAKGNEKPTESSDTPGEGDDANSVPPTNAGDNTNDEIEPDAKKSFNSAVKGSLELQKGIEASPFLYEFVRAVGEALSGSETRTQKSVMAAVEKYGHKLATIEKALSDQQAFNKSLAATVVGIGELVSGGQNALAAAASAPAGGPRSQTRSGIAVINKSLDGDGLDALNKAQVSDVMTNLVKSGELGPLDVIRFESTGELPPSARQKVVSYLNGKN